MTEREQGGYRDDEHIALVIAAEAIRQRAETARAMSRVLVGELSEDNANLALRLERIASTLTDPPSRGDNAAIDAGRGTERAISGAGAGAVVFGDAGDSLADLDCANCKKPEGVFGVCWSCFVRLQEPSPEGSGTLTYVGPTDPVTGRCEVYADELARVLGSGPEGRERPEIICLVGSSRFADVSAARAWDYAKQGKIVLGMYFLPPWYGAPDDHAAEAEGVAAVLDELHLRKIEMADRVEVLNIGGYTGERTRFEIAYAESLGKPVSYVAALTTQPEAGERT